MTSGSMLGKISFRNPVRDGSMNSTIRTTSSVRVALAVTTGAPAQEQGCRRWFWAVSMFFVALVGGSTLGCGEDAPPPPPAITSVSAPELLQLMESGTDVLVLDVRSSDEHAAGHIAGAVNIPHTEIEHRLGELSPYKDKPVIVCCWAGGRADSVKGMLRNAGFASLYDLRGHMAEWVRLGYPVERATAQ